MKVKRKRDPLYVAFTSMRSRCNSPACVAYPRYGGRGIAVCSEWDDFATFKDWAMGNGYRPGLTLDRKDNDGGYSPDNCRWATHTTQARNRRAFSGGSSQYIGVSWHAQSSKWSSTVCVDGKNTHLGRFVDEESAARARDTYLIDRGLTEYTLNFP